MCTTETAPIRRVITLCKELDVENKELKDEIRYLRRILKNTQNLLEQARLDADKYYRLVQRRRSF